MSTVLSNSRKLCKIITEGCKDVCSVFGTYHNEIIYHKSLSHWLLINNIAHDNEFIINYFYKGKNVGYGRIDIFIPSHKTIIEIKNVNNLSESDYNQVQKYMEWSNCNTGYLINFPKSKKSKLQIEKCYLEI